jgi:hypothetical protein
VSRAIRSDVAVLYVDPGGVYPSLVEHWYDEARDARTYAGPFPVVAHPPCGPWGRMKFLCTRQDPSHGPFAVGTVRELGGVLEHPANSGLFRHCKVPFPGELPDAWGGYTIEVNQVSWGHRCQKRTWLYCVGVPLERVLAGLRFGGVATRRVTNGSRGVKLPRASNEENRRTPIAFAEWLISLASYATGRRAA